MSDCVDIIREVIMQLYYLTLKTQESRAGEERKIESASSSYQTLPHLI